MKKRIGKKVRLIVHERVWWKVWNKVYWNINNKKVYWNINNKVERKIYGKVWDKMDRGR